MPCYGDYPEHLSVSINGDAVDMSTAIFRMYLSDGFIIAADGRQTREPNDELISDTAQKIFSIQDENRQLAYSICGTHLFTSTDGQRIIWELRNETDLALRDLSTRNSPSLQGYATRLARPIHRALELSKQSGEIAAFPNHVERVYPHGSTIAELNIDGYYRHIPSRVTIRFFHVQQQLQHPSIFLDRDIKRLDLYGSSRIWTAFDDINDNRLASYRPKNYNKRVQWNLDTAAKVAAGYIRACSSPESHEIDECVSKIIGGHIHIATIKPHDGFRWVTGFEPISIDHSAA